jgi:hypothetical protein
MLKYDVVIGRTTNNPGTAVDVDALEITLYKSEELDFGVFTIPATARFENYQILDRVDITVTDGSITKVYDPFLVISDEVTPVSKKGLYKHTVTFIEDIHKFEKILSSNVFFTQPLDGPKKTLFDALNHIRDVVPFERASVHSDTRLFNIDSELETFLRGIEAPQFFFTGMNLREMINAIASYVNAIGRMENNRNLVFSFYNEILELFDANTDVINRTLKNQTKYFTSSVESSIENATGADNDDRAVIVYPSPNDYISIRAAQLKVTDETFEFRVPYPIERIQKVEYRADLELKFVREQQDLNLIDSLSRNRETLYYLVPADKYYRWDVPTQTFVEMVLDVDFKITRPAPAPNFLTLDIELYVDVTPHVYEFNNYKQLDLDLPSVTTRREQDLQSNTLHYEINGTKISNNRLSGVFDSVSSLESFYRRVLFAYGFTPEPSFLPKFENWDKQNFRITYVPYFGTRVRLNKDDVTDHPYNTQMSANQGERIVSAERLLRNIYGMAQRLGQDEIEFKRFYSDLGEMFELGRITEDGFVIASQKITYYLNYYVVTYLLSKNFNRFANRIALNQENRPFDIGRGSKTTNRNLLYNEYVEIDTEPKENTSLVRVVGRNVFMNTLQTSPSLRTIFNRPVRYGIFGGAELADTSPNEGIILHPVPFSEGNSLNFYWSFDDVVTAGDQLGISTYTKAPNFLGFVIPESLREVNVYNNRVVRYTDNEEKLNNFEVSFNSDNITIEPNDLPIVTIPSDSTALIGGHSVNGVFNDNFVVRKDKAEILSMNYVLSVVPNFKYNNKIVVGRELTFSNNLIIANKNANLLVYTSENETYNSLENRFVKGNPTNITYTVGDESGAGQLVANISENILNTISSWAIGDDEGNLYLGVNVTSELRNVIYFNFRNKRENISYTFDDIDVIGLTAPRNLTLTTTQTTITATWQDDQASDFYEIGIRQTLPTVTAYQDQPPQTEKTITFTGLTEGNTYQVRVRSVKGGVASFYVSQSTIVAVIPSKVQNFRINRIAGSTTSLSASWGAVSNVTGYTAQFRLPHQEWDTASVIERNVGSNTTTITQSAGVNQILVGRVQGKNNFGFGEFSDEDAQVIPLVTGLAVSALSNTTLRANWNPLTNLVSPTVNQEIGFNVQVFERNTIATGTTTFGATNQSIVDSTKSFTINELVSKTITFDSGVFNGFSATITANTATTITFTDIGVTNSGDLVDIKYSVVGDEETTIETRDEPYTSAFYDIQNLKTQTLYRVTIRAYYEYKGSVLTKRLFSATEEFFVKTLEESLPDNVLAPVITVASGFPTQTAIRWNIFNPNDFEVTRAIEVREGTEVVTPTSFIGFVPAESTVSFTIDSLPNNAQRTVSVRFRVGTTPNFVLSTVSSNTQTTLPPSPPGVPQNVSVSNVMATSALVSWSQVGGATNGYEVLLNPANTNNVSSFTTTGQTATSRTLLNLAMQTTYTVQVRSRSVGGSGPSAYSEPPVQFTTLLGPPNAPALLSLSKIQSGNFLYISGNWSSVSGATGYDFNLASDSNFNTIVFSVSNTQSTTASTFPNSPLLPGTYYGRVRAKNTAGDSAYVTAQITIALTVPQTPANASIEALNVGPPDERAFRMEWTSVPTSPQYEYQFATNSNFTTIVRSGTTSNLNITQSWFDGARIYGRVRAVNNAGASAYIVADPTTGVLI